MSGSISLEKYLDIIYLDFELNDGISFEENKEMDNLMILFYDISGKFTYEEEVLKRAPFLSSLKDVQDIARKVLQFIELNNLCK